MKKILSMLLVLTLMFALAVPAFAAADTDGSDAMPHQKTINVYAELDLGEPEIGGTVYYTEITWDIGSIMTEKFTPKFVWNPNGVGEDKTPQYVYGWTAEDLADTGWANTEANFSLTLTNRSNAEVDATVRYWGAGLAMDNPKDFYNQPGMGSYTGELNLHDDNRSKYCVDEYSVYYDLDDSEVYYFDSFYASLANAAPETPSATNLKGAPQSLELTGTIGFDGYAPGDIFPSGTTQYSVGQVTVTLYVD